MEVFYLLSELTSGCPSLILGAFIRYPSILSTVSNLEYYDYSVLSLCLNSILSNNSVSNIRSSIIGAASNESSQTLYSVSVCVPPMNISDIYSSIAFLVSPAVGTYLITI